MTGRLKVCGRARPRQPLYTTIHPKSCCPVTEPLLFGQREGAPADTEQLAVA